MTLCLWWEALGMAVIISNACMIEVCKEKTRITISDKPVWISTAIHSLPEVAFTVMPKRRSGGRPGKIIECQDDPRFGLQGRREIIMVKISVDYSSCIYLFCMPSVVRLMSGEVRKIDRAWAANESREGCLRGGQRVGSMSASELNLMPEEFLCDVTFKSFLGKGISP